MAVAVSRGRLLSACGIETSDGRWPIHTRLSTGWLYVGLYVGAARLGGNRNDAKLAVLPGQGAPQVP